MEQHGNASTYNLESVLVQNIKSSHYYISKLIPLDNVHEIIDEIYDTVDHVEPWLSGNARGPSSAFCLLFRLGELKPSPAEIREMLDHKDSPYIRAVGFLYLRYCANPRDLWSWFKKYMRDGEEFMPSPEYVGKTITIGTFARDILLDQYYFETIFPRIPKTVADEVKEELRRVGLPITTLGNAGQGGQDRRGTDDGSRRPASVKASLSVAFGQRAPNRAGTREVGRGMGADLQLGSDRDRGRDRERDRGRGRGGGGNERRRSRSPGGHGRHGHGRHRNGGGGGGGGGGHRRGRSRSRSRSRDRREDRGRSGRHGSRSRSRERGRERDHYERGEDRRGGYSGRDDRGRGGDRRYDSREDRYDDRDRDRRGRSRSRSRSRDGGRDVRDVFKERPIAPKNPSNLASIY